MVAVDTNIIVRFLTQDDELQYQNSLEIFQTQNVFIPDTVNSYFNLGVSLAVTPLDVQAIPTAHFPSLRDAARTGRSANVNACNCVI